MLAKASYIMVQGDGGLLSDTFQEKYLKHDSLNSRSSIRFGASLMRDGLFWRLGTGCSARFWVDDWTGCGLLSVWLLILALLIQILMSKTFGMLMAVILRCCFSACLL